MVRAYENVTKVLFQYYSSKPHACYRFKMSSISPCDEQPRSSPVLLTGEDPEAVELTEYAGCVISRVSDVRETNDDDGPLQERESTPVHERYESTASSDGLDRSVPCACGKKKLKGTTIKLKDEHLDLRCEWQNCNYHTCKLDLFVRHVSLHIPQLLVEVNEDLQGVYACLWEQCGYKSADSNEITRHVNFHSYHTKLKSIGSNILSRLKLPVCAFHDNAKNMVPDLPLAFECCWNTCEQTFNCLHKYFSHVETHVYCSPRDRKVDGNVRCHWRGCTSKSAYNSVHKLADHVRSHTQEKRVGCPTCGGLFSNRTKFSNHCMNQIRSELQVFQCSQCRRHYPSKELLQNHMNEHVNHYKCPICGKTFPWPSSLNVHIRYRHLDNKPFKCTYCDYRAKMHHDMKQHLNTHRSDPLYRCEEDGCDFSCRSAYGLRRHHDKFHIGYDEPQYCCHVCDRRFFRGSLLTRHLRTRHGICRPSGHSRFRYRWDEDGLFRLQNANPDTTKVTTERVVELEDSQPLCGSCNGQSSDADDPLAQEAAEGEIVISVMNPESAQRWWTDKQSTDT